MANKPGFKSSAAGIVIGDANVAFCSLDGSSSSDAFGVSVGNTSQRPSTPKAGMLRWNSDSAAFEFYNGTTWLPFGGGSVTWEDNGNVIISSAIANFVDSPSLTWNVKANGAQVNISATATISTANAANTVAVYVNGNLIDTNANLNFINTATVIALGTSNVSASNIQANVAFSVNQAAQYKWTGIQQFDGPLPGAASLAGNITLGWQSFGNSMFFEMAPANSTANLALWEFFALNTGSWTARVTNDAYSGSANWLHVVRSANGGANANVSTIGIGNSPDFPVVTLTGNLIIQRPAGACTEGEIFATDGHQWVVINSNTAAGAFNPLNAANDRVIIASVAANAVANTGALTLTTWAANASGIRITNNQILLLTDGGEGVFNINVATMNANGNIFSSGNVTINNLLVLSDQPIPGTPPNGNLYIYSDGIGGTSNISQLTIKDEFGATMFIGYETHIIVFNNSGATLPKGSLVYINGTNSIGGTDYPNVALAKADSITTMPVIGLCQYNIANGTFGEVHGFGPVSTLALTTGSPGARLYLSDVTAGLYTLTPPSTPGHFIQVIGTVINSGAGNQGDILFNPGPVIQSAGSNGAANTVAVYANGTIVANQSNLNFNNSATVNVSATANGVDSQVNVAFSVNSTAIVGGANLDIQYNNNGTFGGDANLLWNVANTTLIVSGNLVSNGNTFLGAGANTGYVPTYFGGTPGFLHQDSGNKSFGAFFRYEVTPFGPSLAFGKSRGIGAGNLVSAVSGDELGDLVFIGTDGTNWIPAARMYMMIDNTVSTNTIPSAITFLTTTANTPTERMRISSTGNVGIGTANPLANLDVIGIARANTHQDHYSNVGLPANFSNTSSFITSNNVTVFASNGTILVTDTASANWDAFAYGQAMTSCMIRGQQVNNTGSGMMIGLTQNPATMKAGGANQNTTFTALDFAASFNVGNLCIFEAGTQVLANQGTLTAGNGVAVMYDGNNVSYFANTYVTGWVRIRTVNKPGLSLTPAYVGIGNRQGNVAANIFLTSNQTIDGSIATYQDITLSNNILLTLQNCATTGNVSTITLFIRQTAQTNCGIAFSNTIRWSDNTLPGLSAGPNTGDIITLITYNGGTSWWGSQAMGNVPSANIY